MGLFVFGFVLTAIELCLLGNNCLLLALLIFLLFSHLQKQSAKLGAIFFMFNHRKNHYCVNCECYEIMTFYF